MTNANKIKPKNWLKNRRKSKMIVASNNELGSGIKITGMLIFWRVHDESISTNKFCPFFGFFINITLYRNFPWTDGSWTIERWSDDEIRTPSKILFIPDTMNSWFFWMPMWRDLTLTEICGINLRVIGSLIPEGDKTWRIFGWFPGF